jgi:branched-chain amino acid aminotransferase
LSLFGRVGLMIQKVIGNGKPGPVTKGLQAAFFDIMKGKNPEYREWLDYL